MSVNARLEQFNAFINETESYFRSITEKQAVYKASPEVWSAKEIVGHLIDSAFHNHIRFMTTVCKDDMVFGGYPQVDLVNVQQFESESWDRLVTFWKLINDYLLSKLSLIDEVILTKEHRKHTLDKIAMKRISADTPATLLYLVEDYFDHINVHLNQIKERLTSS